MRIRDIFAQTAADLGSATKEDFVRALAKKDIKMDDHRLSYHIRMAEMSGTLCSGELLPMKATYALAADKVKPMAKMDKDEALIRLWNILLANTFKAVNLPHWRTSSGGQV